MNTDTIKISKATKYFISLFLVLFAILFFLVLRTPSTQSNNLLGDNVSIRQQDGNVQWKLPNSDWQTITTVAKLTGEAGKNGADGKNGANGKDGKDGQTGNNGKDG